MKSAPNIHACIEAYRPTHAQLEPEGVSRSQSSKTSSATVVLLPQLSKRRSPLQFAALQFQTHDYIDTVPVPRSIIWRAGFPLHTTLRYFGLESLLSE